MCIRYMCCVLCSLGEVNSNHIYKFFFSNGFVVKFHYEPFEVEDSHVDLKLGEGGGGEVAERF